MTIFQFFLQTKIEQLPIINTSAICEKQQQRQRQRKAFFHLKSRAKQKKLQSLKWFISSKILCNEDDEETRIKEDKPFEKVFSELLKSSSLRFQKRLIEEVICLFVGKQVVKKAVRKG